MSGMPLLMLWLRREARLRWPALLACCLLMAITSATVLTAVAGARRGASTVTRLLAVTRPATAEVVPNEPGFDWNRIRALPEVEALTTFPAYTGLPTDVAPANAPNPFVPADTEAMRTIETPVVLGITAASPASRAPACSPSRWPCSWPGWSWPGRRSPGWSRPRPWSCAWPQPWA